MLGGIVRGRRAELRTTTEADLADHLRWHADPELTRWMPYRPRPGTLDQRREWLKRTSEDRGTIHWEIAVGADHVGYCTARLIWVPFVDTWQITHLLVDPGRQRAGIGGDAARAAHRYFTDYLSLEAADAWLYRDDAASRRIAERLGYEEYAHGHEVFYREGRWWDDWRGLLRTERFRELHPNEREYPDWEAR